MKLAEQVRILGEFVTKYFRAVVTALIFRHNFCFGAAGLIDREAFSLFSTDIESEYEGKIFPEWNGDRDRHHDISFS
jgi:hypothetical protein